MAQKSNNLPHQTSFFIIGPPVIKIEDVSVFKLIQNKLGIEALCYISCPCAMIKLHFSLLEVHTFKKNYQFLLSL